jgi:hypothetical protein
MNDYDEKSPARVSATQLSIVGALGVIFAVVLFVQFGPGGDSSPSADSAAQANDDSAGQSAASGTDVAKIANAGPQTPQSERPWPTYSLETVLEFDPFAKPSVPDEIRGDVQPGGNAGNATVQNNIDAEKKRLAREQGLAEARKETVQAIIGTERGFSAIVGEKTITVGDRLHGFAVKEITADGVVLEDNGDIQ